MTEAGSTMPEAGPGGESGGAAGLLRLSMARHEPGLGCGLGLRSGLEWGLGRLPSSGAVAELPSCCCGLCDHRCGVGAADPCSWACNACTCEGQGWG